MPAGFVCLAAAAPFACYKFGFREEACEVSPGKGAFGSSFRGAPSVAPVIEPASPAPAKAAEYAAYAAAAPPVIKTHKFIPHF